MQLCFRKKIKSMKNLFYRIPSTLIIMAIGNFIFFEAIYAQTGTIKDCGKKT